jgi:branched-chain amino acid transport system ATP-binding protein
MAEKILWANNVSQHFGGLVAVDQVSMELNKGEIVGIIGPNGAGKTTFFNDITGMYDPTEGQVFYRGKDITGKKPYEVTELGITRTFQNIRLFDRMTVIENVMVGVHSRTKANIVDSLFRLKNHKETEKKAHEKALSVLELTGLADFRYNYATSLPYGSQRKLEIARALAAEPEILLLDEPGAGMNEMETSQLIAFIRELRDLGYTILIIEHDMRVIMNICDRIYVLDHGKLIAQGKPSEIQSNSDVIEAYLGKEH